MKLRVAVFPTVFAIFMVFMSLTAFAAPPFPGKMSVKQPSGEEVFVTLHGDEHFHWYEAEDGTVLLRDGDGWLRYAQYSQGSLTALEARYALDGRPAGALLRKDFYPALKSTPPRVARAQGVAAVQRAGGIPTPQAPEPLLVILASFNDISIQQTDPFWSGKMFADYSAYSEKTDAHSSVNDYYKEVSDGEFWFGKAAETGGTANDGVIRVSLPIAHPAYPSDSDEQSQAQFEAQSNDVTSRALAAVNQYIDFAAFDKDHSGVLTPDELHIVIILAGYEQSYGDTSKAVWAHSFGLPGGGISLDGVRVGGDYTQQGEIQGTHPATIGVLSHELGHSLGLPDLYDYGYDSQGVGPYSLMAVGSWEYNAGSNPGSSPTHLDAWSKYVLGFVTPEVFASGSHELSAVATGNYNVIRVPATDPKQYFLLENRQNNYGYDKPLDYYFRTGGVAIWHIDEQVLESAMSQYSDWYRINDDQTHKAVDLEEANLGYLGYAQLDLSDQDSRSRPPYNHFFRTGDATCGAAFDAGTTPSSRLYDGSDSGVKISVASPGGNVMTVNLGLYVSSLTPDKASPLLQYRTVRWTATALGAANITYKFDVYQGTERVGGTDGYSSANWFDWAPTVPASNYTVKVSALGDGVSDPVMKTSPAYIITADTVPPAITAIAGGAALAAGGSTRSASVTAAATDPAGGVVASRTYTFNGGAPVDSWPTFTDEGAYVLTAIDQAGNKAEFSFSIDRTAPAVQASTDEGSLASGAITSKSVTIAISDLHSGTKSVTQNGAAFAWPAGGVFSQDGAYAVTAADIAGNKTTFSFTVDKTAPVIRATANSAAISSGQIKSAAVTVTVIELHLASCTATRDGAAYAWPDGGVFSQDGVYVIEATDQAGNQSSFTFTVDRTAPTIAATAGGMALEPGQTSGAAVTVEVTDAHLDGAKVKALKNGVAYAWPADGLFAEPGVYTITAADLAGNTATFRFGFLENAGKLAVRTAAGYVLDWECVAADVTVELLDEAWSATISRNGAPASNWADSGAHIFAQEGRYAVTCTDGTGAVTLHFTVDKSNPVIAARNASGGVVSAGSLNKTAVTVTVADLSAITLTAKRNGSACVWPTGGKFTAEGSYIVTAKDTVGHTSFFSFAIDLAAPAISARPATGGKVANKGYSRANTTVVITDVALASKSIKKDGKTFSWPSGGAFTADGVYAITATDKFGRVSTFSFTLDKTLPAVTARLSTGQTAASGGYYRYSVTVTVSDKNLSSKAATKNGKAMAWPARNKFTAPGSYRVTAYDKAGNSRVFTFVIDTAKPVVAAKTLSGATVRSGGLATGGVIVTVSESYPASKTVKLGTKTIAWPTSNKFTAKGAYTLTVKDKAGNMTTFRFTVR